MLSDSEVVARVVSGDHPLFELIMRRYNRRLYRLSYGILGDELLAQDAVQEAYVNAFLHLEQFRGPDGFGAWLMRIASRSALRAARKEVGLRVVLAEVDSAPSLTGETREPEQAKITEEIVGLLEQAVESLPRDFRVVMMLRVFEGMSTEETADLLNINPATVKTRLHRAKQLIRTRFKYRLDEVLPHAYPFAGARCDAIVQKVFDRIKQLINRH
ncbi:MAG: RNA polymerase sigma factor [Candidatus Thiodiazotropha sp. (ex Monitilora ramsayi)]|nr:RNA polymerase sigma factor [Candidatus Thiodiazotropha sp. (ex Monitilora ramsayi)]